LLSFWYGECALVGKKFADKYSIKHYCWMWGQDAKKENKYVGQLHLKEDGTDSFPLISYKPNFKEIME